MLQYFNADNTPVTAHSHEEAVMLLNEKFKNSLTFATSDPKNGWICPLCGSGTGSNKTGMTLDSKRGGTHYTCWACFGTSSFQGKSFLSKSPTDIIAMGLNIDPSSPQAFGEVCKYMGITRSYTQNSTKSGASTAPIPTRPRQISSLSPLQGGSPTHAPSTDYTEYYKRCNAALLDSAGGLTARQYLKNRGITWDSFRRFNLGYDSRWLHPSKTTGVPSKRIIIPRTKNAYLARAIDPESKYPKQAAGGTPLFSVAFNPDSKVHIVVEGEFDAIVVAQLAPSYSVIGLGGLSNALNVVDFLFKNVKCPQYGVLLALDNDYDSTENRGQITQKKLANALRDANIPVTEEDCTYLFGSGCKDPNEAYLKDKEGFYKRLDLEVASAWGHLSDSAKSSPIPSSPTPVTVSIPATEPVTVPAVPTVSILDPTSTSTLDSRTHIEPFNLSRDDNQASRVRSTIDEVCGVCQHRIDFYMGKIDEQTFRDACGSCKTSTSEGIYKSELVRAYFDMRRDYDNASLQITQLSSGTTSKSAAQPAKTCTLPKGKGKTAVKDRDFGTTVENLYREGKKITEIAQLLGMSRPTVYKILGSRGLR